MRLTRLEDRIPVRMIKKALNKEWFHANVTREAGAESNCQTMRLKWPMGNVDKRNDRIQETLRPYRLVIRNKLFQYFIARIFKIDPEQRVGASDLLNDSFITTKSKDLVKYQKPPSMSYSKRVAQ